MFQTSSQHHSFDIALASKYGIEEAILIHHFMHWIRINRLAKRNIREGRCWTYQSRKEIQLHFPYWTFEQVKYLCERLVKMEVLITGNFNKSPIDRTLWYAFKDEKEFGLDEEIKEKFTKRENSLLERENSLIIPDTISTYSKKKAPIVPGGDPPVSKSRETIREPKTEIADRVFVSPSQHQSLLKKAKGDEHLVKSWYQRLSDWKIGKEIFGGKNDYQTITNWVIDAVKEAPMSTGAAKASMEEENRNFARRVEKKFENNPHASNMTVGNSYIEFRYGNYNLVTLKFTDNGFKEQVLNNLRKMNLQVDGLC